ncbi:MAG: class I tRNA ligase family protein, partial [Flavobacteriaceae bacterium]|nr:class I tRNA ligase family protein [Flavobacteriaceae bacterium]
YRLSDALTAIYKLIWDDFSSWFLEMVKPEYGKPIDAKTLKSVIAIFEENIKVLHPFMPFITEEIWQYFGERNTDEALIISDYPKQGEFDESILNDFEITQEIVSAIRNIRKEKNISFKEVLELSIIEKENLNKDFDTVIKKLCNISTITKVGEKLDNAIAFRVKSNEFFIPFSESIDVEAELKKLTEELNYNQGFLKSVQKKLSNERFVNNAPEQVITIERKKEADAIAKIAMLEESLKSLKG